MKKSIMQINEEMKTVNLIKKTLDVDGMRAFALFNEWTGKGESKITGGTISSDVACEDYYEYEDEKVSFKDDVEFSTTNFTDLQDELNNLLKSLGFETKQSS